MEEVKQEKGTRKLKATRETMLAMLLGFIVAAVLKAPVELYLALVVGLGGKDFAFMWGNRAEHQAAK